jgi:threonine aldolase
MYINLISDTVTKPTKAMLEAMFSAEVGDDVFGEDPTVKQLEEKLAAMFGKEAGLFCPSGTMTNQIAIKMHTRPLDEVLCHTFSHVYQYETGGYAFHSGVAMRLLDGDYGLLAPETLRSAFRPLQDWLPNTSLLVLENTANKGGGSYYTAAQMRSLVDLARENGLATHLDGARLFNALIETKDSTQEIGQLFDSISICLSKGLGAPVGSVLLGTATKIKEARRIRKVMGGGMRQAGYLAAAGIYALDHHIGRLTIDHDHARQLAACLQTLPFVAEIKPVKTNIVIFDLQPQLNVADFLLQLKAKGILASGFGGQSIRMVTHLDISQGMITEVCQYLREIAEKGAQI